MGPDGHRKSPPIPFPPKDSILTVIQNFGGLAERCGLGYLGGMTTLHNLLKNLWHAGGLHQRDHRGYPVVCTGTDLPQSGASVRLLAAESQLVVCQDT